MFYIELPEEKSLKDEEKDCSENVKDDPGFAKQSVFYVEMKNAPKPRSSVYGGARKKYAKLTESRTTSIKPAIPPKPPSHAPAAAPAHPTPPRYPTTTAPPKTPTLTSSPDPPAPP